jgi:hypothetical protein
MMLTADTITDAELKQWWADGGKGATARDLMAALREKLRDEPEWSEEHVKLARLRIVAAINARVLLKTGSIFDRAVAERLLFLTVSDDTYLELSRRDYEHVVAMSDESLRQHIGHVVFLVNARAKNPPCGGGLLCVDGWHAAQCARTKESP